MKIPSDGVLLDDLPRAVIAEVGCRLCVPIATIGNGRARRARRARDMAIYLLGSRFGLAAKDMARSFGLSVSAIRTAERRFGAEVQAAPCLVGFVAGVMAALAAEGWRPVE